jgi:hypothetical protein
MLSRIWDAQLALVNRNRLPPGEPIHVSREKWKDRFLTGCRLALEPLDLPVDQGAGCAGALQQRTLPHSSWDSVKGYVNWCQCSERILQNPIQK